MYKDIYNGHPDGFFYWADFPKFMSRFEGAVRATLITQTKLALPDSSFGRAWMEYYNLDGVTIRYVQDDILLLGHKLLSLRTHISSFHS